MQIPKSHSQPSLLHLQPVCAMGLLTQGSPLNWEETKKYADHIRKHGIIQFLNIYNKVKERQKDVLKWGDEVRSWDMLLLLSVCLLMSFDLSVMMVVDDAIVAFYFKCLKCVTLTHTTGRKNDVICNFIEICMDVPVLLYQFFIYSLFLTVKQCS